MKKAIKFFEDGLTRGFDRGMIVSDNKVAKEVGDVYWLDIWKDHARKNKLLEYTKDVDQ